MNGVNGVSGTQGASKATPTRYIKNSDGSITINFDGKQQKISGKAAERYAETFDKVYKVPMRIAELEGKLSNPKLSAKEKTEITNEIKELKQKYAAQQAAAKVEISPDGQTVSFVMKKEMNAEEFKKLYDISDGTLRSYLKKEALAETTFYDNEPFGEFETEAQNEAHFKPVKTYDDAWYHKDTRFEEQESPYDRDKVVYFDNGVKLVANLEKSPGHYIPVYTEATLKAGNSYNINSDYIAEKPFWKFW